MFVFTSDRIVSPRCLLAALALVPMLFMAMPVGDAEAKLAFFRNYPDVDWKVIKTEHFNVFYPVSKDENSDHYIDADFTARKTAYVAEEMYPLICGQFNYYLDETINIVMLDQTDELTGYTVPNFDWIVVSGRHSDGLWRLRGHHDWLRNVMYHEFAHVVSLKADQVLAQEAFGMVVSAGWIDGRIDTNAQATAFFGTGDPWFWVEGGAEYYTEVAGINTWTSNRDMRMRMDILEDTALNFADMADYFGSNGGFDGNRHYLSGYSFALYLEERFGQGVFQSFALKRDERGWSMDWLSVVEEVLGVSAQQLDSDWRVWALERYSKVRDEVMEDPAIGTPMKLGKSYWESTSPSAVERTEWLPTLKGGNRHKWRNDRERADDFYVVSPRMSADGKRWGYANGWYGKITYNEVSEEQYPALNSAAEYREMGDAIEKLENSLTLAGGGLGPHLGAGQFDFSPDGNKIVMTCPEDLLEMDERGFKNILFSEYALNTDGYSWHTLCVIDLTEMEEKSRARMLEHFDGKDPHAEDAEKLEKLRRGIKVDRDKKKPKGKDAWRRWWQWGPEVPPNEVLTGYPKFRRIQDPAWSPDGRHIAFSRYDDGTQNLWVMDLETGDGKAVTSFTDGTRLEGLDWSPDGSQLVFGAFRWSQQDLYIIGADGSGARALTMDRHEDRDPHWGHDGNIYFSSDRVGGIFNIFRLNPTLQAGGMDRDLDGIADASDECPDRAETVNLYKDYDGCPDGVPVRVTAEQVEISEKIFFEFDKAVIKQESFELLGAIARTLLEHPELKAIEIGGHTDAKGSRTYNRELSQSRADSVRDFLVSKGVPAGMLTAQGYGKDKPLATGDSEEAFAENRRVEFLITERDEVSEVVEMATGAAGEIEDDEDDEYDGYDDDEYYEQQGDATPQAKDAGSAVPESQGDPAAAAAAAPESQEWDADQLANAYLVQVTNVVSGAFCPWLTPAGNLLYAHYTPFGFKAYGLNAAEFHDEVVNDTDLVVADARLSVAQEVYPDYSAVTSKVDTHGSFIRNPLVVPIVGVNNVSMTHLGVNLGIYFNISDVLDTNELSIVAQAGEDLLLWGRYDNKALWPEFHIGGLARTIKFDYGFLIDEDSNQQTTDDQFLGDIKQSQFVAGGFTGVRLPISPLFNVELGTFQLAWGVQGVNDGKGVRPISYRGMQNISATLVLPNIKSARRSRSASGRAAQTTLSFNWAPNYSVQLNSATAGVTVDDGQVFDRYFYNEFSFVWNQRVPLPVKNHIGVKAGHSLSTELQLGLVDRNVPFADEIRGGGAGGVNVRNPYQSNTTFAGYEPFSLAGETAAIFNVQYGLPLIRNIDRKLGPVYFENLSMVLFGTVGNFWSYRVEGEQTILFGERVLSDEEARKGGGLTPRDSGLVREWPGMRAQENGQFILADAGIELRLNANLLNRSPWRSFVRVAYGFMPTAGRGDVDGDGIFTNSRDATLNLASDEREPAGFRFYLGIGTGW